MGYPDEQCGEHDGEESNKNLLVERAVGTEVGADEEEATPRPIQISDHCALLGRRTAQPIDSLFLSFMSSFDPL